MSEIFYYIFNISLYHYLLLSLWLFIIGILAFIISEDIVKMVISILFIFTSVSINFAAFTRYLDKSNVGLTANILIVILFFMQIFLLLLVSIKVSTSTDNDTENFKEI